MLYGPDIAPEEAHAERSSYRDVLLEGRLRAAIAWLNPELPPEAVDRGVARIRRAESADVLAENWRVHHLLTHGVPLERRNERGELRHDLMRLVDFDHPDRNDFVVINQMSIEQERKTRRPDVLVFVNGLPLGLIELKVPGQERATLRGAWNQLRTYATEVSNLLAYNAVSVISTGTQARLGALGGGFEHYAPWKTIDGRDLAPAGLPELEVLVRGVFSPLRSSTSCRTSSRSVTNEPAWSNGWPSTTSFTLSIVPSPPPSQLSTAAMAAPAWSGIRRVPERAWRCSFTSTS